MSACRIALEPCNQLVQLSPNYPPQQRPYYAAQAAQLAQQAQSGIPSYSQYLQRQNCGRTGASQAIPVAAKPPTVANYPIASSSQSLYPLGVVRYAQSSLDGGCRCNQNLGLSGYASYVV